MSVHDFDRKITRRDWGAAVAGVFASLAFGGACSGATGNTTDSPQPADGRLTARPKAGVTATGTGERKLGIASTRDALLHLPPKPAAGPLPLLILLHGAGGSGENMLRRLGTTPDDAGVAVLAPTSRGSSWDAIREFGPDVTMLDHALNKVFDTVAIDPARIALGGFSDGATYAVSLGLINGDLFPRIVGFSPGFVVDGTPHGKPRVFISHGTSDEILPFDRCGKRIQASLKERGYDVTFREFSGGHEVPPDIARDAMRWIADTPKTA